MKEIPFCGLYRELLHENFDLEKILLSVKRIFSEKILQIAGIFLRHIVAGRMKIGYTVIIH